MSDTPISETVLVERKRFHVEGQTSTVGPRWLIWDNAEGHYARFQNIADHGDAVAICEMLNRLAAHSDTIEQLRETIVELWHDSATDPRELRECLRMTPEEYAAWANPAALSRMESSARCPYCGEAVPAEHTSRYCPHCAHDMPWVEAAQKDKPNE